MPGPKVRAFACAPHQAEVDGRELTVMDSPDSLGKVKEVAAYDAKTRAVWIKTPDQKFSLEVAIVRKIALGDMSPAFPSGIRLESSPQIPKDLIYD